VKLLRLPVSTKSVKPLSMDSLALAILPCSTPVLLDFPRHGSGVKQGGNPPPGGGGYEEMAEIKEERTNRLR
jgi:hypothetical protein